jgi:branched-chain amino acid transport system ATP-binding protein
MVLMVEHNLSVVQNLCETITVLARGHVIAEGSYKDGSADPAVVAAYLGTRRLNPRLESGAVSDPDVRCRRPIGSRK